MNYAFMRTGGNKERMERTKLLSDYKIAIVIPCYRVRAHVLSVINTIGPECWRIYAIDDGCPDGSGKFIEKNSKDHRVVVLYNQHNMGVGGAVMTGYKQAILDGANIIVKIDGDGQMNPRLIKNFVDPLIQGWADYSKGNRFYNVDNIGEMPCLRIIGNTILSFMAKISTGYWDIFDPTNGFTAIHVEVAKRLPLNKISNGFFFETDMLFRLNTLRAVVVDIPIDARYADEISNLKISRIIGIFFCKHLENFWKRIIYNYFLRDLSIASFELIFGLLLFGFGMSYGIFHWIESVKQSSMTPAGTVMLAGLPIILGLQFLLSFIGFDIAMRPIRPVHLYWEEKN